jgi:hypothetical protein
MCLSAGKVAVKGWPDGVRRRGGLCGGVEAVPAIREEIDVTSHP